MAKQTWKKFNINHPTAPAFTNIIKISFPKSAPILDEAGAKIPTPYGLLVEWLKDNLSGDWASMAKNKVIIVKVADATDGAALMKRFPAIGIARKTQASRSTTQINYTESDYGPLAIEMGYKLR